jgi:hypothetical protein
MFGFFIDVVENSYYQITLMKLCIINLSLLFLPRNLVYQGLKNSKNINSSFVTGNLNEKYVLEEKNRL